MIAIINYGMGNLRSVKNALERLATPSYVADRPADLEGARGVILPGVGAFGDGMQQLFKHGWTAALQDHVVAKKKPFLGICLGMQMLASRSSEHGSHPGLGWIEGTVERLDDDQGALRLPHIGWNDVHFAPHGALRANLDDVETFYFVHSYAFHPEDAGVVQGSCDYGSNFAACVAADHIWGAQFHPEKSQRPGLTLLKNFVDFVGR